MDLGRWQTFGLLWRQPWHESGSAPAYQRIVALTLTILIHLMLTLLLVWLTYVQFIGQRTASTGEEVIQVEYIGRGAPEDTGGGAGQGEQEPEPTSQAFAQPEIAAPATIAQTESRTVEAQPPSQPEPQPATVAPVTQALDVTQTPKPDSAFVLPPTTPPQLQVPRPGVAPRPVVAVVEREIEAEPSPPQVTAQVVIEPTPVARAQRVQTEVEAREIPLLQPPRVMIEQVTVQQVPAAPVSPRVAAPARTLQSRDIPLAPAADARSTQKPDRGQAAAATPAGTQRRPQTAPGSAPAARSVGVGPNIGAPPGAIPTPQVGDDWDDSTRDRPGGQAGAGSGLYNPDGSPRLPSGAAAAGGGSPPGSDAWSRDQLDRHGTWSRNPPLGHQATRFDQYWIPSGTLLQEWVRRGIKSMAIPIPGTTKRINCTISVLQLGGGCGVSDTNLQDQEAIARPPPDIPYKPELQEGGP